VLTAVVALENYDKDKLCEISQEASEVEPYKISMSKGEKIRVEDLVYGMMMVSANDAAEVLAECDPSGKQGFIDKMNEKVKELGLADSHFVTPNGLDDPNHLTSAFDMATITNYAIKAHPDFLMYMGNKGEYSISATDHNEPHWWSQISTLLKTYPGMDGAKTGFTYDAGNTYIGTAERNGRRIIIVYFDAHSTTYDATTLLDFGFTTNPAS
jgi:D-alanyl-D-alanine carboxypeptidase